MSYPMDSPDFVLFGGSFNPVHAGHVEIVRQLSCLPGVAQVLVMPAGQSPFKPQAPLLPADLRLRMLRDSLGAMERVAVLDWELRRPPPSYSVDTVTALRHLYPAARLWFALGADAFADFARWHRAADLLALAGLLVFPRAGGSAPAADTNALPGEWRERARRDPDGNWIDADGRCVVKFVALHVPAVAASRILQERDLAHVPPPARAALSAYWGQAPAPAR